MFWRKKGEKPIEKRERKHFTKEEGYFILMLLHSPFNPKTRRIIACMHAMIFPRANCAQTFKVVLRLCNVIGCRQTLNMIITFLVKQASYLVLHHSLGGKDPIVRAEVLDHQIYVNLRDKGLSEELLTYRIHEPILSVLMFNEIRPGDVIVEVGANIGYYVLIECSLIKGDGKVIAIEPDPRNRKLLKMNVFGNGYAKDVEFVPFAIGSRRGTVNMLMSNAFNVSCVISPWSGKAGNGEEKRVKMMTLDELILDKSKIDVIRMDIEGYEFVAIDGMISTLTKFRPRLLVIELHPIPNYHMMLSFFEKLIKLGYEIKWAVPRNLVDGMLEIPETLLRKTCELIQKRSLVPNVGMLPVERTFGITTFAEKFCSSKQLYHVILTPRPDSSVCT